MTPKPPKPSSAAKPTAKPSPKPAPKPQAAAPAAAPNWRGLLVRNRNGYAPHVSNVVICFTHDPAWRDLLQYNEFVGDIIATRPPPWPQDMMPAEHCKPHDWSHRDTIRAAAWLARTHQVICPTGVVGEGLHAAADRKSIHPVRDWLRSLKWDRKPRIEDFLIRLAGADDTPYVRAVTKNFLVGAVARIMRPGCQLDTMPIFEGEQGIGKTSLLRILGGEWFMSTTINPGDKDSYQILRGVWLVEFGELDSLTRGEVTRIKQYVTQTVDRYRPSYARSAEDFLRQAAFVGTVNPDAGGYLKDPTGARRFQPLELRAKKGKPTIELASIAKEREQLWAEALVCFEAGEKWHITDPVILKAAAEEADDRRQQHPWETIVGLWLAKQSVRSRELGVATHEVLTGALGFEAARMTKTDEMNCATALRLCGWGDSRKVRLGGVITRRYYPNVKLSSVPKTTLPKPGGKLVKAFPEEPSGIRVSPIKSVQDAPNGSGSVATSGPFVATSEGPRRGGGNKKRGPRMLPPPGKGG